MDGSRLGIENLEALMTSLTAVSLAENVVSHLIGGVSARAIAVRTLSQEEHLEMNRQEGSVHTWCIHRGGSSYAIDVASLLPCESPLMRSRSLFEVARTIKEGSNRGYVPTGTWEIDGVLAKESHIVNVGTILGEIRVAVERVESDGLRMNSDLGTVGSKVVSLPMTISLNHFRATGGWADALSTLQGPLSLITRGSVAVEVLQEFYLLSNDIVRGGITMQRVEEELGDEKVLDSTQGDMEGDSTLSVSIHLGEIQLTLAQLAKLRKGHTLRLTEENLSLEGGFSCALTIGSTRLASGKLRFSGDRVVLTIAEVV
jgi:hypothetical protein